MCPPRVSRRKAEAFARALGASIRARRMRMRQTRVELARRSRLSETRIIQVEDGDPDVDLLQLEAVANVLDFAVGGLRGGGVRRIGGNTSGEGEGWASFGRRGSRKKKSKKAPPMGSGG